MCDVWWGAYVVVPASVPISSSRTAEADHKMVSEEAIDPNQHPNDRVKDSDEGRDAITDRGDTKRETIEREKPERGIILLQSCVGSSLVFSVSLKDKYRNKVHAADHIQGLGIRIQLKPLSSTAPLSSVELRKKTLPEEKSQEHKHIDDKKDVVGSRRNDDNDDRNDQQEELVYTFMENTKGVIPCVCVCPATAGEYQMIVSLGK